MLKLNRGIIGIDIGSRYIKADGGPRAPGGDLPRGGDVRARQAPEPPGPRHGRLQARLLQILHRLTGTVW